MTVLELYRKLGQIIEAGGGHREVSVEVESVGDMYYLIERYVPNDSNGIKLTTYADGTVAIRAIWEGCTQVLVEEGEEVEGGKIKVSLMDWAIKRTLPDAYQAIKWADEHLGRVEL